MQSQWTTRTNREKVKPILSERLTTPEIEVSCSIRKTSSTSQIYFVDFCKIAQRGIVFTNRIAMKRTNLCVNVELCPGTLAARKTQMSEYHNYWRQSKIPYFKYRKLRKRNMDVIHATINSASKSIGGTQQESWWSSSDQRPATGWLLACSPCQPRCQPCASHTQVTLHHGRTISRNRSPPVRYGKEA